MRALVLVLLLAATAACTPLCAPTASGPTMHLVFTGPAEGTLTQATPLCSESLTQGLATFHFDGILAGHFLGLNIQIYSGFHGPGTYPVGSLLDGAGEVRLTVGDLHASSATGAGTVTVADDVKSGTLTVNLSEGEHVEGTFVCDRVATGNL
jgi:hypothetical protein